MVYISCITLLLLSTIVLADYHIDNADASIVYSGQSWKTWPAGNQYEGLFLPSTSTSNYLMILDASNCYDKNYARVVCGTGDNCSIQIPFTGSGITMYVFNAGTTGMTASFSVDGGAAFSNSTAPPTAAENYQVSNVSLYDVQGLSSGKHTITTTLMDWEGSSTDMRFDYAHVNESFVAVPSSTTASSTPTTTSTARSSSQTPTQTPAQIPSASNRINAGRIAGITLGVAAMLGGIVTGILWFRKRRASHRGSSDSAPESTLQIEPFTLEYPSSITSSSWPHSRHSSSLSLQSDENMAVSPLMRSAILRDAHAVFSSAPTKRRESTRPGATTSVSPLEPVCRQPSYSAESPSVRSNMSHVADEGPLAFLDSTIASRYNLTPAQVETVRGLLADRVPVDAIARAIEAFESSRFSTDEGNTGRVIRFSEHAWSLESPPSYQTQDRRAR